MNKLLLGKILLALLFVFPTPAMARVDVGISVSLPPPIVFAAPPEVVVIPETYVYAVPDQDVDIFFYNGWWWRPWEGRWYRSRHYDSDWVYYQSVPTFYAWIPSGWRNDYRNHRWGGHQWNYQRIPQQQLQRNWSNWEKSRHWEKQQTWGVQGLKPRTRSQQPAQAVQPRSQAKPQVREPTKTQPSRPQSREIKPQQSRPQSQAVKPQIRETTKPQQSRPQSRQVKPQQSRPQSREAQPQHAQPQYREAPKQSAPRQGNPERGGGERQDRK